ncbi:hypothetical protein D3C85_1447620 [compost metagenome]
MIELRDQLLLLAQGFQGGGEARSLGGSLIGDGAQCLHPVRQLSQLLAAGDLGRQLQREFKGGIGRHGHS